MQQAIEAPIARLYFVRELLVLRALSALEVDLCDRRLRPEHLQLLVQRLERLLVATVQDHRRPTADELARDGAADAGRGTRDHDHASLEVRRRRSIAAPIIICGSGRHEISVCLVGRARRG